MYQLKRYALNTLILALLAGGMVKLLTAMPKMITQGISQLDLARPTRRPASGISVTIWASNPRQQDTKSKGMKKRHPKVSIWASKSAG